MSQQALQHLHTLQYANNPNSLPGSQMLAVMATDFCQPPAAHSHFESQEDEAVCEEGLDQNSASFECPPKSK